MEISALFEKPSDAWVEFQDAKILLAFLSVDDLEEIKKENTSRTYFSGKGESGFKETLEAEGAVLLLGARAVKDWKGITLKGEDCPFCPKKRDLFMTKWPEFTRFVADSCSDIAVFAEQEREADEKN